MPSPRVGGETTSHTDAQGKFDYIGELSRVFRNFNLRAHKFVFQYDLVIYLSMSLFSLIPFTLTHHTQYALIPLFVWFAYNVLFLMDIQKADSIVSGFSR